MLGAALLRTMSFPLARPVSLAAFAIPSLLPCLALQQPSLPLDAITDSVMRAEIGRLGPYPEMHLPADASTLHELALRSWSATHCEFTAKDIRVRIEAQPFERAKWIISDDHKGHVLERAPIMGWSNVEAHTRMSRVELVLDGMVTEVPGTAFTDLFDPPLCGPGPLAPLRFATAARSDDGWRVYVLAQVGQGDQARLVTWVFEDGRYLFRVVDAFRTNG